MILIGREDMKHGIQWLQERADEVCKSDQKRAGWVLFRIAESYEKIATHLETASERLLLPSTDWALAQPIGAPRL